MSIQSTIGVAATASLVLAVRVARTRWRRSQVESLASGKWNGWPLPSRRFRLRGRMDGLRVDEAPSGLGAFTVRPLLLAESARGKAEVLELVLGARRSRRMLSLRSKGPEIEILCVPSVSDLANLLSTFLLATTIGLLFRVPATFHGAVALVSVFELLLRVRVPERAVRRILEERLAGVR